MFKKSSTTTPVKPPGEEVKAEQLIIEPPTLLFGLTDDHIKQALHDAQSHPQYDQLVKGEARF